ncbi:MAG: mgtC [Verrucomicrobiales bacterium]|nr:mgtC [Verrucomicrobiales bacterium]
MDWLIADWRQLIPQPWANVAFALTAVLCGSIVGLEREQKEKPAGMLTLTLVSLGAAVFTMVSYVFQGKESDSSRVAAQVVTGIGFLGAGVILRGTGDIKGTATAAAIWAMAAIGMVAGTGYGGAAVALSLFVLIVLRVVSRLQKHLINRCEFTEVHIVFEPAGGKTLIKIEEALDVHEVSARPTELRLAGDNLLEARMTYCHGYRNHREFLASLAEMPEVKEIRREEKARPR